jgi:16S rRNA (adenine1518-N6/adenine1519-N6)-dimethyltransferase
MKLTDMRHILATRDIRLTKSLGQNFLHDGNQIRRIIAAAELTPADRVLEIGPGLGPLTEALLPACAEVFAIEKDQRLVEVLAERFAAEPRLRLLHADALAYLQENSLDWSAWKLVANLPYSVASPMLVELCLRSRGPQRVVATLQLEVAQRLMATADSGDYGLLSLLIQIRYEPRGCFRIPASCFFPAPEIDSACVTLVRRATPLLADAEIAIFERVIRRGFSQRRKKLFKLLKEDWAEAALTAAFAVVNLAAEIRAEQVSLEQFASLARELGKPQ